MAALKHRMKSLFSGLQRDKGHDEVEKDEEIHAMQPPDLPHAREDLRKTEEVISEINDEYFKGDEVDCGKFELEKLGPEIEVSSLEDRIFALKTQDNAIYRKIYDLVFANYTAYVQELENVTMLQLSLQETSRTCVGARRQLKLAREGVSHGGLGLLAKHRKRERLKVLLDIMKTLKTLQRTDTRLKELLQEGDYPAATQLCLECQNAIQTFKQYTCVRELASSLQDIQHDIERELEEALGSVCRNFIDHHYEQVQQAYMLLGKTQTAVDILLMKFTTTIHDSTYSVVAEYIAVGDSAASTDLQQQLKTPYASLCKLIPAEAYIPCLKKICQTVWKVMHNYHQIKKWHETYDRRRPADVDHPSDEAAEDVESNFNKNYVRTKLENGLLRVWRDVQQKVRPYVLAIDMSSFKYDDFLRVLDIINRLISVGREFCGEGSESLQESVRQQSLKYFRNFHRARLDELKIFLENEAWELCPVRSSFTIHQLREFRFLRSLPSSPINTSPKVSSPSRSDGSSLFVRYSADEDPFTQQEEEEGEEDVIEFGGVEDTVSDDEGGDEDEDESSKGYLDEETGELVQHRQPKHIRRHRSSSATRGPILANTTLNVIRIFGNYIQMMNVLRTIAFDVLECLSQLFDFYLFAVHEFFIVDLLTSSQDDVQLSTKLKTSLKRISDTLIIPQETAMQSILSSDGSVKVPSPVVSTVVKLQTPANMFGLQYRMVAVESLIFLASQFESLMPYLKKLVPDSKQSFLTQFLSQTVKTSLELRKPVYYGIASKSISYDQILSSMNNVKWDIKDIMSQHSGYVDRLLQEFVTFKSLISSVDKDVFIPPQALNMLWERAITLANQTFVEGFAQAKKCSNEGRALMQLDFQQFRTQIERMSNIRPLPGHSYVEDYIKAYYLSESDTEHWVKKHLEYSSKQLQSLVSVGVGSRMGKRSRQKLLSTIEELDRQR